jgi:hypothetical protein
MSVVQAVYSFLPWLRHGLGAQITSSGPQRPQINVNLQLVGDKLGGGTLTVPVTQTVDLYGPGDVQGIDSRVVIRVEPRDWTTNYEPNYLPHIEFYDEDFPWRYTPGPNNGEQLLPWLTLVVLEEEVEFKDNKTLPGQPLPTITVANVNLLPDPADLWAWAHVHVNRDLAPVDTQYFSTDTPAVLNKFESTINSNPDLAHSRIVCPRKLRPNAAYHAFLIPTFETGRLTGLKLPTNTIANATTSAWANYPNRPRTAEFPVFFRWYFRTGGPGDFEELVRLLKPKRPNPQVGVRDMDMQTPGAGLPGFADPLLKLGGALRIPRKPTDPDLDAWEQPDPHPFQLALANFINLADDYAHQQVPDPVITAPLYGCWHALMRRLLQERDLSPITPTDNWFHELNLDPRYRVPAGFGTGVVQQNQEEFMQAAWEQVGDILEANRRIRLALLAREVAFRWFEQHLRPLQSANADGAFALTGPVHRRITKDGKTVHYTESISHLSTTAVSAAFRRITRPRSRLMKSLKFNANAKPDNLLTRMGTGIVTAAPPKAPTKGLLTVAEMAKQFPLLSEECWKIKLPECANLKFTPPDKDNRFQCEKDQKELPNSDSARFKKAREEQCVLIRGGLDSGREPPPIGIDIPQVCETVVATLNPLQTIPDRLGLTIHFPPHLGITEQFQEAMAYPRIDKPMYGPLKDISSDLFLPNFHLIEQNSITLLETNQKFIEAYMVGLNHEFARELLWREYPTDQRGSYFRQFWSVEGFLGYNDLTPEERKEKLYDIPPLHLWSRLSKLGEHDNRELNPGDNEQELVLVIRGELLKRYPNIVVYAQAAKWQTKADGSIDNTLPREIEDLSGLTPDQLKHLPRDKARTPLYEAKVAPDVTFLGFDLTAAEAQGDPGTQPTDKPGWFFMLKERPGEPRFGLDEQLNPTMQTVNDLSWKSILPALQDGDYLPASGLASFTLAEPPTTDEQKHGQFEEDNQIRVQALSSARWAYLLLQSPVMMAVHATEMLPK